jgi:hypothetical protein
MRAAHSPVAAPGNQRDQPRAVRQIRSRQAVRAHEGLVPVVTFASPLPYRPALRVHFPATVQIQAGPPSEDKCGEEMPP